MGEFSEAHLGSAAAQKGSVGGRRVGEPEWTAPKLLRGHGPGAGWVLVLGALTDWWAGRPPSPGPQRPATGPWTPGLVGLPWVPGRGGTCRVPDMTGSLQGSGVGGWARWFSCIHGRMSSGLSGRSLGSPGFARLPCSLSLSLCVCVRALDWARQGE